MSVAVVKEQTAFRFEPELITRMKSAAKRRKQSLNQYVTDLIVRDLEQESILPAAVLSDSQVDLAAAYAGKMSSPEDGELSSDCRLAHIWTR